MKKFYLLLFARKKNQKRCSINDLKSLQTKISSSDYEILNKNIKKSWFYLYYNSSYNELESIDIVLDHYLSLHESKDTIKSGLNDIRVINLNYKLLE